MKDRRKYWIDKEKWLSGWLTRTMGITDLYNAVVYGYNKKGITLINFHRSLNFAFCFEI